MLLFFFAVYLRNLPLVKLLCLPNFGFYLNYHVEPEIIDPPKAESKKGGKKKDKKGGKDKKKKKK